MDLKVRNKKGVYIIDLECLEIDHNNSNKLNENIIELIDSENIKFIALNMEKVAFVTSVGVGVLLNLKKVLNALDGEFCLFKPNEQVADSIRVLMIDRIMQVYDSEDKAIKYLTEYDYLKTKSIFEIEVNNNISIVKIADQQLDLQNSGELESICSNLIEKDKIKNIILDFSETNFITSSGIGAILSVFNCANNNESEFVIFGLNKDILESLEISMVDKILNIENTKEDAINYINNL